MTEEGREKQMINLAVNLAEEKLRDGSASTAIITHYLKLGTVREQKELEMLEMQKKLVEAKTKQIEDSKQIAELYSNALNAMRSYSGNTDYGGDL